MKYMNRAQFKIILIIVSVLYFLTGCSSLQNQPVKLSSFSFTDQHGEEFGLEDLKGKMWISNFIFTSCETVCPPMTAAMADIQEELLNNNMDIEIVSFSVDPLIDTPEKLDKYLSQFTDNDSNWKMLTGYKQEEIEKFALEEFQTLVNKPSGTNQVLHGVNFYLVDIDGVLVSEFNFTEPGLTEKVIEELENYRP
ncbi:SCO family protein [Paenisporosarcina sp. TG-14]|uniref:SCO family protein n=1 Tax=Paenisporosarcina sp. TG-14 TaxID=1231057 RepID=UPI0002F0A034|nr:SCO family protein [Paenisporosarcina sp. TG-14]